MTSAMPAAEVDWFIKNKKIAIVVPCLHVAGGSVKVATWMANRFAEICDVALISCDSFSTLAFDTDPRVRTFFLNLEGQRVIKKVLNGRLPLTELLVTFDVDLIFAIGTYEALVSLYPARKKGVPLVFCDHGALINQWNDYRMRIIRWLDARFSSKTVTLTEKSRSDYVDLLGIPEGKVRCIPNAIAKDFEIGGGHYCSDANKILWAGRLSEEKGVDYLLEIASRVLPSRSDWVWDVYGAVSSDRYKNLPAEIEEMGLGEQLILKGHAKDMKSVYCSHSIGVLTSLREGLPLFLLEGKACGLPLVSFDVDTGPRDILSDGEDGYLVDCYDIDDFSRKLGTLMDDLALRERMSAQALRTVGRFSEECVLEKWLSLIGEVLAR